jgi:hypothetical protein
MIIDDDKWNEATYDSIKSRTSASIVYSWLAIAAVAALVVAATVAAKVAAAVVAVAVVVAAAAGFTD